MVELPLWLQWGDLVSGVRGHAPFGMGLYICEARSRHTYWVAQTRMYGRGVPPEGGGWVRYFYEERALGHSLEASALCGQSLDIPPPGGASGLFCVFPLVDTLSTFK